jgi:hypothetical protein
MTDESAKVSLVYRGEAFEKGKVPVDDMVDALAGFSGAFAKVARLRFPPHTSHRIRIFGLRPGSAVIGIDIIEWVTKNPAAAGAFITGGGMVAGGIYKAINFIVGVIRGKKALEGQTITNNNYTVVNNGIIVGRDNNAPLLTKQEFEVLKSGDLDPDIDRMTAPLNEGRGGDEFRIRAQRRDLIRVEARERPFLAQRDTSFTTTRDNVWLEGTLNSHSKRSNRGMFYTLSGKRIPYHYIGDDLKPLLDAYAHSGPVRVLGRVTFDSNLEPVSVEIYDVQPSQPTVFWHNLEP